MLILSASPSRLFITTRPRVSSSSFSSSSSKFCSISAVRSSVRRCPFAVFCCSNSRGMAEMVEDKEEASMSVVAASSASENSELGHSRTFLDVRTEEDILSTIRKESEAGRLPSHIAQGMEELYQNYRSAVI